MASLCLGGHEFLALAQGALFWPARDALIVADLHLEKASWYAQAGQMLPPYDSLATLDALERLVDAQDAREVWVLGDSFHDAEGPARLPADARARLCGLIARLDWTWITGNHDAASAGALGGAVVEETAIDGIIMRHRAHPGDGRPELSGHYHPKWRVAGRSRTVSRRCFVQGQTRVILPAFGALAGGLNACDPAIRALAGPFAAALVPVRGGLLRFPIP